MPFIGTNYGARNATWWDPNMRNPYVMNWSAGFQYQFTNTWLAELLYQGSAGVGLLNNWDINVLPLNVSNDLATLNQIRIGYQNFKPYSQFGSIQHYSNYGHNTYHGATLRVEKRYSSGVTLNTFWTWSKTINDVDEDGGAAGITWYNRQTGEGSCGVRHQPPIRDDCHVRTPGRKRQAIHELGRLEERASSVAGNSRGLSTS